MIQRIQSLFLFIAMVVMIIAGFWSNFFDYFTSEGIYHFNSFGISKYSINNEELIEHIDYPIYIILFLLAAFTGYTILGFKNLKKQLRYTKLLWGFYIITLLGIVIWRYFIAPTQVSGEILEHQFSFDFYLLVIGLPFVQMAITYIGKDIKKIESIDRLR